MNATTGIINHSVLVAVRYAGQDGTVTRNMYRIQINVSQKKLCVKLVTYQNSLGISCNFPGLHLPMAPFFLWAAQVTVG